MDHKLFYLERLSHLEDQISGIKSSEFKISMFRLLIFILFVAIGIYTFQQSLWMIVASIICFLFLFLLLVKKQISLKSDRIKLESQVLFYNNEIQILEGHRNICFNGTDMADEKHAYAFDLDIIGTSSLFEKINRTKTYYGIKFLGEFLLKHPNLAQVKERQEAVSEIANIPDWREDFHGSLFGLEDQHSMDTASKLEENLNFDHSFIADKRIRYLILSVPLIWVVLFLIYFVFGENYKPLLYGFGILIFIIYFRYSKNVGQIQLALSKSIENFDSYIEALNCIFNHPWQSLLLKSTIAPYQKAETRLAVNELAQLKKLIDLLDYRLNMIVGITLNLFLLWDFRIINKIGIWKEKNTFKVKELFSVLGLFETLSSLSIYKFNHIDYTFPHVSEGDFLFQATNLKHPLIKEENSIGNDFEINESSYVNIVTGSNMSGKSTFLRAVGINIILGNSGTVCSAKILNYNLTRVMTYMRIKDSLEENASTFKAELNRIKQMLEILNHNENTLLLIDEMLRGTNSKDKLKGSIAIAKKILQSKTHCIIATHDLQLTSIEKEAPKHVSNYYFDIDFHNGELRFDYKIKPGVCQNFNASYLLEQIGIDINPTT